MKRKPYPTDLTDKQWQKIEPLIPPPKPGGRDRKTDMRELVNALRYLLRGGVAWRLLPHDFPPHGTVWWYYWTWRKDGTWLRVHDALREQVRTQAGKEPTPSAGVLDSQSVKTTEKGGPKGYDAAKQVKGRKRTLVVDTLGLLLDLWVHPADIQDYDAGKEVLATIVEFYPRLKKVWAEGQFGKNGLPEWAAAEAGVELEIVKRPEGAKGFVVQAKRWIVERTLGWLNGYRRLSKDYEATTESSETMIYLAMIDLMVTRLAPT